ncbi:serine protease inhibitor 88Ea-like [Portunus trituberculatus]|uniref:serine protease inhibitor 88Ea-like n=1 Tax=Portunus trituberculatus TaxID=210409 RepID=UPI001E1D0B8D|nr:serine protease inhibitor 88Ea-like [Portunus trituberculatus]XP_045109925.1 serine protease inhibitor 88Ea-like [Portunus trituberculatus]XP_045109935.1 serine protease inhibitor 88Ea-like [Portunus trituberculatus]
MRYNSKTTVPNCTKMLMGMLLTFTLTPATLADPECIPGSNETDLKIPISSSNLSYITDFGLDLFRELFPYNATDRNFFFSPYSVWSALSLAYFGSAGETEDQIAMVLREEDKVSALKSWKTVEFLYKMRQENQTNYTLRVANRAYFDLDVSLRACLTEIFPSELQRIDFRQPDAAAVEINDFVSNTTKGRIPELVTPGHLQGARMVLVNAAFFKGVWLYQFKESATKKELFYSTLEDYTFVDMMHQKGNFGYGVSEELGASILELPYTGEAISMYILLPPFLSGRDGFSSMVARLTGPALHRAIDSTWRTQLEVKIPKFKLEEMIEEELMEALSRMGVTDLFDPTRANMTTFSEREGLSVGRSVHRAFVEVSEEGTEAAAATALISWRIARPVSPTTFEANHPFLFLIYDNLTHNVLFLGAYKNPKAAQGGRESV